MAKVLAVSLLILKFFYCYFDGTYSRKFCIGDHVEKLEKSAKTVYQYYNCTFWALCCIFVFNS